MFGMINSDILLNNIKLIKVFMTQIYKNSKGFSLIEIMIVMGLATIVGLAVMKSSLDVVKSSKRGEVINKINGIAQTISLFSTNEATCKNMLSGNNFVNYAEINGNSNVALSLNIPSIGEISKDQEIGDSGLKTKSFEVRNIQKLGADGNNFKYLMGVAYLNTASSKGTLGGNNFQEKLVTPLQLKINSAGKVVSCSSVGLAMNPGNNNNNNNNNANSGDVNNTTTVALPDGSTGITSANCNAECVVRDFFNRNPSTTGNPQLWMNQVGVAEYSSYAEAYSGNNGVNAVETAKKLGVTDKQLDDWVQRTVNNVNGQDFQKVVTGVNKATDIYTPEEILKFKEKVGNDAFAAAAKVLSEKDLTGLTKEQINALVLQEMVNSKAP